MAVLYIAQKARCIRVSAGVFAVLLPGIGLQHHIKPLAAHSQNVIIVNTSAKNALLSFIGRLAILIYAFSLNFARCYPPGNNTLTGTLMPRRNK